MSSCATIPPCTKSSLRVWPRACTLGWRHCLHQVVHAARLGRCHRRRLQRWSRKTPRAHHRTLCRSWLGLQSSHWSMMPPALAWRGAIHWVAREGRKAHIGRCSREAHRRGASPRVPQHHRIKFGRDQPRERWTLRCSSLARTQARLVPSQVQWTASSLRLPRGESIQQTCLCAGAHSLPRPLQVSLLLQVGAPEARTNRGSQA
mmetsp:Transcript_7881/g.20609  ORF Transcript_7881/g.20609 Transcript_7881/m.20609 type:complete len:204 (-) Transcript_7881:150-761(-)